MFLIYVDYILGYHEKPAPMRTNLIAMHTGAWIQSYPHITYIPNAASIDNGQQSGRRIGHDNRNNVNSMMAGSDDDQHHDWTLDFILKQLWSRYPMYLGTTVMSVFTLFTLVVWMCGRQV
jgi:hypothetical protein